MTIPPIPPPHGSIRICPNCETTFEIELGKNGRPPIYCKPSCKHEARLRGINTRRFCPQCQTEFFLEPGQAASTTFDTEICKAAYSRSKNHHKGRTCALAGCTTKIYRTDPTEPNRDFCTEIHAVTYADDHPRTCPLPSCTEIPPYREGSLRKPPRFCCAAHRLAFTIAVANANGTSPISPDANPLESNRNARQQFKVSGHLPLRKDPTERADFLTLTERSRDRILRDGWTASTYASTPGTYSPAIARKALGQALPDDPPLSHITITTAVKL